MARPHRALGLGLGLALALILAPAARAQGLRPLHVVALSMRADKTRVSVGETFHLAIHVRVRERVAALDELVVPDVGTMHLLGDERTATAGPNGTDVVETLTLEATTPGPYTFPAAYLDAIDARTKKPSRFSANPVRIVVANQGGVYYDAPGRALRGLLAGALIAFAIVAALAAVVVIIVVRARRRPVRSAVAAPPVIVAPAAPARTPRDDVGEALRAYRSAPAEAALRRLRATLFAAAGARPGATLRDALTGAPEPTLGKALHAAEHAAFGPAAMRDDASRELVDAVEGWLR
jgi:hypothetical protein